MPAEPDAIVIACLLSLMLVCTLVLYLFLVVALLVRWRVTRDLTRRAEELLVSLFHLKNLRHSAQTKQYTVSPTRSFL